MSETFTDHLTIASHKGTYTAYFDEEAPARIMADTTTHVLVDSHVADIYAEPLQALLSGPSVLRIEATEANKSLDRMPDYVRHLVSCGIRRDHVLLAIGGGIVQDITCFLAATLLRGIDWKFLPTTLLAQADSCIGSKSSINAGDAKNILGTFTPPREVFISTRFLATLDDADVRSGVGEMLKVHAIDDPDSFALIASDYNRLFRDPAVMMSYIRRSLEIKKSYIEQDEFDRGPRNIFNYGHSFGHAIEAATDFAVPHGIAVTIGMDMANYVAGKIGFDNTDLFERRHEILKRNFRGFENVPVPLDRFINAIAKDKKNVGADLVLILPDSDGVLQKTPCQNDNQFAALCADYLDEARTA